MQKISILSFTVLLLLILTIFFFNNAYQKTIKYGALTNKTNRAHDDFLQLSKQLNNAAVINPDLVAVYKKSAGNSLFFTDSEQVVKQLKTLLPADDDSVNAGIVTTLYPLVLGELPWMIASNVPDSIIHHQAQQHIAALQTIDSLINAGIGRTDFLLGLHKENLQNAIATENIWMVTFVLLTVAVIFYTSYNFYTQSSMTKSKELELELVFNRIRDGVFSLDNNWRYTFANDTSLGNNKMSADQLIGQSFWELHPEIKNTSLWDKLHEAKITGNVTQLQEFSASEHKWFSLKMYPSKEGITIFYADITDSRQAAIRLKEATKNEQLFSSIVNSSDDAIISKSLDGIITSWNKGAETIFGYSENEAIGQSIQMIIPPGLSDEESNLIPRIKKGEYIHHYETERVRKDGSRVQISLSVSPVFDAYGNISGASKIARDITDKKNAEAAILKANTEKNIILESIDDAFFAVDHQWNVTYWNNRAEIMLRKNKIDMIGRNLWAVFADSVNSVSYFKYHHAMETSQSVHFEDCYKVLDKWYDISAYPSENGLAVYFKDITFRKTSELRLIELNQSLQYQAKELARSNAELEQFAYVASHDLQEPLRMVGSFLTQLDKKYNHLIDEKGKTYIRFAVDGAKRMRQIILDLLDFSRVGRTEDKMEDVDINEILNEIKILFRKQLEEKKAVINTLNLPVVHSYRVPLLQVFQNLISNALKYSQAGIPAKIEINAVDLDSHWQFSVSDNGIGINEEFYDKIFIIFQRLHNKDEYSGTGMGLAITKKIIENLGGKIWLESVEGEGSAFYFVIEK